MALHTVNNYAVKVVVTLAVWYAATAACSAPINDTGQTQCYDPTDAPVSCGASAGADASPLPRQDARYGRDAQAASATLNKIGAGAAGFDFSKVANNGSVVPAATSLGSGAADWACTKDNVTGLTWEIKTTTGLRAQSHTYTWYATTSSSNGGNVGAVGANTCGASLAAAPYNNQCNTQNYVAAVNALQLCGATNWRLPTRKELLTLVNTGVTTTPRLDPTYFPNTSTTNWWVWTSSTHAQSPSDAWYVDFSDGNAYASPKSTNGYAVRLVHGP